MKKAISKIFITALAVMAITAGANAQNGRFSIGPEIALPMGTFGDSYSLGIGGSLGYEHPIGDAMGIGLRAGYITFSGKDDLPSYSMIPAQAFFKYYFGGAAQEGFYGMANLGIHNSSFKTPEISWVNPFTGQTEVLYPAQTYTSTDLSFGPEIGYHLENFDFGARYQIISTTGSSTSYLGFRLAYVFGEK